MRDTMKPDAGGIGSPFSLCPRRAVSHTQWRRMTLCDQPISSLTELADQRRTITSPHQILRITNAPQLAFAILALLHRHGLYRCDRVMVADQELRQREQVNQSACLAKPSRHESAAFLAAADFESKPLFIFRHQKRWIAAAFHSQNWLSGRKLSPPVSGVAR